MPDLVLGPLLRYVGQDCAHVWVETDLPCEVEVLGAKTPTFHVAGHHYALVQIDGLERGTVYEYEVHLDGEGVWPEPDSEYPPSRFRTYPKEGQPLQVVFGSCRVAAPNEEPHNLPKDQDPEGREIDALRGLAKRMLEEPFEDWPDLLLMLGDQVYADETSPATKEFIRTRRSVDGPAGDDVLDFEEYTKLYLESWSEKPIRWLLSTVSSAMIFDDHDVHDDWNISATWIDQMRTGPLWDEHIIGALMSYWVYQHIGNLRPRDLADDELFARVHEVDDAGPILREFSRKADREPEARWSFHRDLGGTRLVVIDSRAGRVLDPGARSMLDREEWEWLEETATGGFDHLLLATSLPWVLMPALHDLEAWNEAVCDGAWGKPAAWAGEKVRQAVDLEHWAAFRESFTRLGELQRAVGAGERGTPPATILTLSGDVHHAYLAEVGYPRGSGIQSGIYQAVCSPFRNPLNAKERRVIRSTMNPVMKVLARGLRRAAGVPNPEVRWRQVGDGPWFDNQFATLLIDGRSLQMRLDKVMGDRENDTVIEPVLERQLA